jgi:hypothetical protein
MPGQRRPHDQFFLIAMILMAAMPPRSMTSLSFCDGGYAA